MSQFIIKKKKTLNQTVEMTVKEAIMKDRINLVNIKNMIIIRKIISIQMNILGILMRIRTNLVIILKQILRQLSSSKEIDWSMKVLLVTFNYTQEKLMDYH